MPIIFHTKKINIQNYYKILSRSVILQTSYNYWQKFKKEWEVNIIPVENAYEFNYYFQHLNVETSDGIAWGITGKKVMYLFVVDSRNPFTCRSNAMPIGHELLHAITQDLVGTSHIRRKHDTPDGRAGTDGPAATVLVHDVWYGTKKTIKFWISWGLPPWLPITIPYLNLREAKKEYRL